MFEKVAREGYSGRKIHRWLRDIEFKTINGKPLWLSNVYRILNCTFYYGEYEYPHKSGNWYKGIHTPIITKELFVEAQKKIRIEQDLRYENKEFAFTKLVKCGRCGSGITAEEKYKKLKDGSTAKYIYYGCTRSRDLHCNGGYLREEELILQLLDIVDHVSLDELGLRKRLKEEVERYHKFQSVLGLKQQSIQTIDIDMKNYAKYILKEGSIFEKRELLSHLKDRLTYTNKVITLTRLLPTNA